MPSVPDPVIEARPAPADPDLAALGARVSHLLHVGLYLYSLFSCCYRRGKSAATLLSSPVIACLIMESKIAAASWSAHRWGKSAVTRRSARSLPLFIERGASRGRLLASVCHGGRAARAAELPGRQPGGEARVPQIPDGGHHQRHAVAHRPVPAHPQLPPGRHPVVRHDAHAARAPPPAVHRKPLAACCARQRPLLAKVPAYGVQRPRCRTVCAPCAQKDLIGQCGYRDCMCPVVLTRGADQMPVRPAPRRVRGN